jgi:ATP-dependent Lon protease
MAASEATPGIATGLAYTPTGGEILFIEATRMPGNANLNLTGQLGDVMRESAHAAFTIIRSRSESLGIDPATVLQNDYHVHVPAGAIPKDGPSAGCAIFVALVSLLTDRCIDPLTGITGEITLRGRVMPVGGIKEKVLAAHRAGLRRVILPDRNHQDLDEVPKDILDQLDFVFAKTTDDILRHAFDAGIRKAKRASKRTRATAAKKTTARKRGKTKKAASKKRKKTTRRKAAASARSAGGRGARAGKS